MIHSRQNNSLYSKIVLAVCMGILLWYFMNQTSVYTEPYANYQNDREGYKVDYPKEWTLMEHYMGECTIFIEPGNEETEFPANLVVSPTYLSHNEQYEIDDLVKVSMSNLKKRMHKFEPITTSKRMIAGLPASQLTYNLVSDNNIYLTQQQTYIMDNRKIYIITLTASRDKFQEYLPQLEHMISSFQAKRFESR